MSLTPVSPTFDTPTFCVSYFLRHSLQCHLILCALLLCHLLLCHPPVYYEVSVSPTFCALVFFDHRKNPDDNPDEYIEYFNDRQDDGHEILVQNWIDVVL